MSELLNLDGYGAFVWPSYLVSVILIGVLIYVRAKALARAKREDQEPDSD